MNDCYVFNLRTTLAIRVLILRLVLLRRTAARGGTFGPPKSTQKPDGALPLCPRHPEPDAVTLDCSITERWSVAGLCAKRYQADAAAPPFHPVKVQGFRFALRHRAFRGQSPSRAPWAQKALVPRPQGV